MRSPGGAGMSVHSLERERVDAAGGASVPLPRRAPAWRTGRFARSGPRRQQAEPGSFVMLDARLPAALLQRDSTFRRFLASADAGAAGLALLLVVVLWDHDGGLRPASLAALPLVILISKVIGLYEHDELALTHRTLDEAPALFELATLYALFVHLSDQILVTGALSRVQLLVLWVSLFVFSLASRGIARLVARRRSTPERCLVVGDPVGCRRIREKVNTAPAVAASVVGTLELPPHDERDNAARLDVLREAIVEQGVHRLLIAPGSDDAAGTLDLVRTAKALGVRVSVMPRMLEVIGSSIEFDDLDGLPMLSVRRFGISRSSWCVKRGFDIAGSVLGLVVAAPILLFAAVMIRLDSPGPVFFRQLRIGRHGAPFEIVKFRTMVADAEDRKAGLLARNETNGFFKIADDPRITRAGHLLRRTAIDELPQLINVLRGQMSLVGPRPLVADEDCRVVGLHRHRLHLTPGMTGHWQILGSSRIPLEEMITIDYLYVANWSLWNDVKILLRTVPFMLARRGL
jgi:exopolysaccharide biosynthesis polyprenyl glycosylphosphotransferase